MRSPLEREVVLGYVLSGLEEGQGGATRQGWREQLMRR
jgi:hypothetical protein